MCGICGFYDCMENFMDNDIYWRDMIFKMNRCQGHRGNLYDDVYLSYHCGLGETKSDKSISKSHKDTKDKDYIHHIITKQIDSRYISVIMDGDIYNYSELKKILESVGFVFDTDSYEELIIYGFSHYGKDFIKKLTGIYSIAILESTILCGIPYERLYLVTDRLGVKPVFYGKYHGLTVFASEKETLINVFKCNNPKKLQKGTTVCFNGLNTDAYKYSSRSSGEINKCLYNIVKKQHYNDIIISPPQKPLLYINAMLERINKPVFLATNFPLNYVLSIIAKYNPVLIVGLNVNLLLMYDYNPELPANIENICSYAGIKVMFKDCHDEPKCDIILYDDGYSELVYVEK